MQGVCRAPDTTCAQTTALICAFSDGSCIDLSPGSPSAGLYCVDSVGGSCSVSNKQARALIPRPWMRSVAPVPRQTGRVSRPSPAAAGMQWAAAGTPMLLGMHAGSLRLNEKLSRVTAWSSITWKPLWSEDAFQVTKLQVSLLVCCHMQQAWHALMHDHATLHGHKPSLRGTLVVQVPGGVCQEATPTYLTATSKFCGTLATKTAAATAPNCCNPVRQRPAHCLGASSTMGMRLCPALCHTAREAVITFGVLNFWLCSWKRAINTQLESCDITRCAYSPAHSVFTGQGECMASSTLRTPCCWLRRAPWWQAARAQSRPAPPKRARARLRAPATCATTHPTTVSERRARTSRRQHRRQAASRPARPLDRCIHARHPGHLLGTDPAPFAARGSWFRFPWEQPGCTVRGIWGLGNVVLQQPLSGGCVMTQSALTAKPEGAPGTGSSLANTAAGCCILAHESLGLHARNSQIVNFWSEGQLRRAAS